MNEYIAALVDEFYQLGVRHAVFSPGSRSTTMAMLFTEYEGFETYMNVDERSASFMALGIDQRLIKNQPCSFVHPVPQWLIICPLF